MCVCLSLFLIFVGYFLFFVVWLFLSRVVSLSLSPCRKHLQTYVFLYTFRHIAAASCRPARVHMHHKSHKNKKNFARPLPYRPSARRSFGGAGLRPTATDGGHLQCGGSVHVPKKPFGYLEFWSGSWLMFSKVFCHMPVWHVSEDLLQCSLSMSRCARSNLPT